MKMRSAFPLLGFLAACQSAAPTPKTPPPSFVGPDFAFQLPEGFEAVTAEHWKRGSESIKLLLLSVSPPVDACEDLAKQYGKHVDAAISEVSQVTVNGKTACRFAAAETPAAVLLSFALKPYGLTLRAEGPGATQNLDQIAATWQFSKPKRFQNAMLSAELPEGFSPARHLMPFKEALVFVRTDRPGTWNGSFAAQALPPKSPNPPDSAKACQDLGAILAQNRKLELEEASFRAVGEHQACVIDLHSKKHPERKARQYQLSFRGLKVSGTCNYDEADPIAKVGCETAAASLASAMDTELNRPKLIPTTL